MCPKVVEYYKQAAEYYISANKATIGKALSSCMSGTAFATTGALP
jgi:hypothetical protein